LSWVKNTFRVTKLLTMMLVALVTLAACGSSNSNNSGGSGDNGGSGGPTSSSGASGGSKLKVGLAFDIGGRGDQSFGTAAAVGLDKAKSDLGVTAKEAQAVQGEPESAKEERLRLLAQSGLNPVIAVGFAYGPSLKNVAPEFPETKFGIIDDASAMAANIANLTFAENEGSYLVGAAGALKSKTGNIGFIGGVQVPLIKKFQAGFEAGAKAIKPGIKVQVKYLTQPPDFSGFGDPAKAKIAAEGMYQNGADVIYTAAGGSGAGTFAAAKAANKIAIGVDSDQAKTADANVRDVIITSMIKRVDVAVYAFIKSVNDGQFKAGQTVYDLKAGGIDYSTTGGKVDDITSQLNALKEKIVAGTITVPST
jgi:basic membrane protein A